MRDIRGQDFRSLAVAAEYAAGYRESLNRAPAGPRVPAETLRGRLARPLADGPVPAEQVIHELVADCEGGIMASSGGRCFAWVTGGTLPAALAADWLASAWDQNPVLYASGPAASVTEDVAGEWLKQLLNIPQAAGFAFVTGCQMAHVTCLAAARHRVLRLRGWDAERQGLAGAPRIRMVTGSARHGSVVRAVRLLGLGTENLVCLPVDDEGAVPASALAQELGRDAAAPTIVVLQAGDVNRGAYDRFGELIPIAKEFGAWVHVDGAFGLWAAASPQFRHFTEGAELADSWATDGHKWLNVPYDCGYAFVRDRAAHLAALSHREPYLVHDPSERDGLDWTPEWSRRARGFATYAALRSLGRNGVAELVERCCERTRELVAGIGRLPGAEVVSAPRINQALIRFFDPLGADHDGHTDRVIAKVNESGEAYFSGTSWGGMRCMRVSVSDSMTSRGDVERAVEAFRKALAS
jgi:aromatic-L-amino-acid decarboxylase